MQLIEAVKVPSRCTMSPIAMIRFAWEGLYHA
jgi:hypothetical protein